MRVNLLGVTGTAITVSSVHGRLLTRNALDLLPTRDDNRQVTGLTEPQMWVLIGVVTGKFDPR